MAQLSRSVIELIGELTRLPGIGRRSAERIAYHLLRVDKSEALALATAIERVRETVHYCQSCFHLAESSICEICDDKSRDDALLCVVEHSRDLLAIESSGKYRGRYHVLLGKISPLDGVGPDQLTIEPLVERIARGRFTELILATNPTVEGDGTALYLSNRLAEFPIRMTKLARGITSGSVLEHANKEILADALTGRQPI